MSSVPMIEPSHVVGLPKGQCFALIEGGHLWKVRMPLPAPDPDEVMPKDLAGAGRLHAPDFTRSVVVQEPGRTAHELVDTGYEWVFVRSGLLERMSQTAERARAPSHGQTRNFRYHISQVYVWAENYLIAAAFTTLTFLVRLLVLVLTLPLIFTAAFVGLIDGLVRRDVRRFGAGRESGFIYHRAKASLMPLAVLPWITYLALPISVHPLLILLPSAALLGLAVSLTAGSFKKYL
jgi:integrating conjugative element membrane protein (TIGR03747 family)